jgi:hypothetical protein
VTRTPTARLLESRYRELAGLPWDDVAQSWVVATKIIDGVAYGLWVHPLMYTTAILVGPVGEHYYADRWCYASPVLALEAARAWGGPWNGGEPDGWHRHPSLGRRRDGGDPATERVER